MSGCGCVPGKYLCHEARRLWMKAGNLYEAWRDTRDDEDWQEYLEAKRAYGDHADAVGKERR